MASLQTLFFAASLLLLVIANQARAAGDLTLVQDGKTRVAIHIPPAVMADDKPGVTNAATHKELETELQRRRLRESVSDLAHYLRKISGAQVRVLPRAFQKGDSHVPVLVGDFAAQRFGKVGAASPFKQRWRMVVSSRGVGLFGETAEASSYAIYELLDRLGVRWFMPGELGEHVPQATTIRLKPMDVSGVPDTHSRLIWYADEDFKRRNRLVGFKIQSSHALMKYLSKEQLTAHPEWNAERNGKRDIASGFLCEGNPEVAAAVASAISQQLDERYVPSVSLSPNDGIGFCECRQWCKPLDAGDFDPSMKVESITDRFIVFCNRVVERVTKKHPTVQFGFYAYVQHTRPPVREKLHPNLVPVIAPITYCRAHAMTDAHICPSRAMIKPIVEGWGKAAKRVAYHNYMFHLAEVSVPYPMIRQMSRELPIIYGSNTVFWQPETLPNFESVLPGMWLTIRMAWDSEAQPIAVLNDFFKRFYGGAEQPMRRYWQIFDRAWTETPEHAGSGFGYWRRFPPQVMQEARAAMDAALRSARTITEYRRVKLHDESLRQFERFMQLRWDLNEGRTTDLSLDSTKWLGTQLGLADEYSKNCAFDRVSFTPNTVAGDYFNAFFRPAYQDAARLSENYVITGKPLRQWKYQAAEKLDRAALGWMMPEFADATWKTTDIGLDSWSTLGLDDYYGTIWYRTSLSTGGVPAGKKMLLWLSTSEGPVRVFVNGQEINAVNAHGEKLEDTGGYCQPKTFDVTSVIKANGINHVAIAATRAALNEIATGGLLGPVYLFQQK